jgi:hypothetical protein
MTSTLGPIHVHVDNYVHAATSAQFEGMIKMVGGVNRFGPVDECSDHQRNKRRFVLIDGQGVGTGAVMYRTDQELTVRDVPVDGFWSISIYNRDGYFEENPHGSYSQNSVIAEPSPDGSFMLNFGTQPNGRPNFLYVMPGWSYNARLYQPRREVLDGDWHFPVPRPVG